MSSKLVSDFGALEEQINNINNVITNNMADWKQKYQKAKADLAEIEQSYETIRTTFGEAYDSLKTTFNQLISDDSIWDGNAADAFADKIDTEIMKQLEEMANELEEMKTWMTEANNSADAINANGDTVIENIGTVKAIVEKVKSNNENTETVNANMINSL